MADNEKLGSTSPQVLLKNAINLDKLVNDRESESLPDRFDVLRRTWFGMEKAHDRQMQSQENRFDTFIASSGYDVIGDYTSGPLKIEEYNQLIRYNNELYKLTAATDIPFTTAGNTDETWTGTDASHFVSVGDAALRQNLGSDEEGMGTWLSFHVQKGMVKQTLNDFLNNSVKFVTPFMFKSLAADGNWSAAIAAADAKAAELGLPLMGFGQVFSVRSLALISDHIEGINFIPHSGYSGAGPTLTVNQTTGRLYFKGSVKGFISSGVKVIKGGFTGIPTLTLDNTEFSYNGNLIRTTCVNAVNTASDYVIPVASAAGFAVGNFVWIGDSKCTIASISGNTITLVNDGTKPILLPGGEGTGSYAAGQFLTKDGDGKNGITIGSGGTEQGWNLNIINGCKAIGNGWFGVFHYVKAIGGNIYADGSIECANNGYCGLGLSYVKGGKISGFNCYGNGNNGLDIFETTSDLFITDGVATGNGVDGVFASGNGTAPKISKVKSFKNFRIGILAYGRSSAPIGYNISDCECTDNGLNDVCYTGVRSFNFRGNTLGGAKDSLKIEGRNGLLNPDGCIVSENVFTKNSTSSDITANVGGYTSGGDSGRIFILNNYYNGRTPSHKITNFNRSGSRFSPAGYLSYTPSYTATTGATISVSIVFYKPNTLNNIDVLGGSAEIQICSNPALLTAGTVSGAVRTAGIELSNGGTTTGKILAMAAFGTLSYNFTSTTAKTVYLNVKTDHGDVVITLTWSD
ncbi:right-handed parallel beta-helix repeat-containing protein [Klebsiella michiganensis]|uniref:right-handed parallel beta-helix repeat-containing protein n=2 Tax=Klebsiella michiganensis TaxID=1134687 RepID=UPI003DA082D9